MPSLQPFDRHPADPGALSHGAQRLAEAAAQAIDASKVTLGAFAPAPLQWDGMAAPELLAAPRPVRESALALSDSLSWTSVAVQFWSMKVRSFNDRVEEIRRGLEVGRSRIAAAGDAGGDSVVQAAERAHALQALEAQARRLWLMAYHVDIVAGAQTAAGMVQDGPTSANVAAAAMVGLLPFGQPWTPIGPISRTFHRAGLSPFEIPFPLVPLDQCPLDDEFGQNFVNGMTNGAQVANAFQLPFKDGLLQMLGGSVGNAGVDAVNEETGACITPLDLPQPPPPPKPPDPPGVFEQIWNAGGDAVNWADNAADDAADWVDQAGDDIAWEIENGPFSDPPPIPLPPLPGPSPN